MVVLRESSRGANKPIFKSLRSRVVYLSYPIPRRLYPPSHFGHRRLKWLPMDKNQPPDEAVVAALNYLNQNSDSKYQLVRPCSVTPVLLPKCILSHVDFIAKNTHVADAPEEIFFAEIASAAGPQDYSVRLCVSLGPVDSLSEEIFFAEVANAAGTLVGSVRLCVSLGPVDSLSGDRLNGCCYCRQYNNVWHPKGGGFVRGHDKLYETVQDICATDMNQNDAISDHGMPLPMLKQVSQALEPTKESQHVDNASLYATEVVKLFNQKKNKNYKVVKPGFATRVILTKECSLFHVNFKVKETDPNAPVKLCFAELTITNGVYTLNCCLEFGKWDIKSGNLTGDETNGCYYCHEFNKVRHPMHGKFVRGGDSLYKPEEEFLC